jgi:large subunit ribosomal protein L25
MANQTPTINAQPRDRMGTRYARRLRQAGRLPAIVYGHGQKPVSVSVDEKETLTVLRSGTHLVNLAIEGTTAETCLVKDLQFGYLGDNVVHVDFARVDLDEEVTVQVHIHYFGESPASKKPGAVVAIDYAELEVVCKAGEIPSEIRVDLSKLEEDAITVSQITLPPGVKANVPPETPLVHIEFVAEEVVAEAAVVAGPAEPEVITAKKEEEPGEAAEEKPKEKKA